MKKGILSMLFGIIMVIITIIGVIVFWREIVEYEGLHYYIALFTTIILFAGEALVIVCGIVLYSKGRK